MAQHTPHKLMPYVLALVWYSILALFITLPLAFHLTTHLPTMPGDLGDEVKQNAWNIWWVSEALQHYHTNPYHTPMLFYPQGASLYLHTLNVPQSLLGVPLLALFGMVPTYNLLTLCMLTLSGYSTFLLARYISGNNLASLVAGTVVVCSPQRLNELRLGQLPTLSDYAVPLALLALLIALERRTWRSALLVAIAISIAALSTWYHLFHFALMCSIIVLWRGGTALSTKTYATLTADGMIWARIGLLTLLLLLPVLLPTAYEAATAPYAHKNDALLFHSDIAHILPHIGGIWQHVAPNWLSPSPIALVALLLAVGGVVAAPRRAALWATIAIICAVLSLGAWHTITLSTTTITIPMPYAIFRALPLLDTFRAPGRIISNTNLMLALLAAIGIAGLLRSHRTVGAWVAVPLFIILIILETVRLPFPIAQAQVSPFYSRIATEPGEWSILELPLDRVNRDVHEMFVQTYHGKYILTGMTSRDVPRMPYESAPPIAQVEHATLSDDIVTMIPAERMQLLRGLRVRYMVVRPNPLHSARATQQVATARQLFGSLTQVYTDDELTAYRIDAVANWLDSSLQRETIPLYLGRDLQWETPEQRHNGGVVRWLPPDGAGLWTYSDHRQRVVLELTLYSVPGKQPFEVWLNGKHIQTLPIPAGSTPRHYYTAPFVLPHGTNLFTFAAPGGGKRPRELGLSDDERILTFGILHVQLHAVQLDTLP